MIERLPIRRAGHADVAIVRALSRQAYAKWVPLIGREPKPMVADYNQAVLDHIIDLWEEEGQVLALIEMIPMNDHLLIENLAVRPDKQGQGLGDRLLRHAERLALSLRLNELRLYTNAAFTSNLMFYSRRNYHEFRRETVVPGSVAVHMRKILAVAQ